MAQNYDGSVFLELFFTLTEKDQFSQWNEVVIDRSFVNRACVPLFKWVVQFVPDSVAPNAITLAGALAILQAWYFCQNYAQSAPLLVTAMSILSIWLFWLSGGLDGQHAKRTMNNTSLGELFKFVCELVSSVFLMVVLCTIMLEPDFDCQWYCVQTVQFVLLLKHYSAFMRQAGIRYLIIGPGEFIFGVMGLLTLRGIVGVSVVQLIYDYSWGLCCKWLVDTLALNPNGYVATMSPSRAAYLTVYLLTLHQIGFPFCGPRGRHRWSRMCLAAIVILRGGSGLLRMDVLATTSIRDVIFDGLFMSMVTSDVIAAKMASRELHVWVVVMATMVVVPHLQFLIFCFVVAYYIAVFADLMHHMNLPLLTPVCNVYCDGIYDMCHIGHKSLFRKALKLGNRLFVGVVGDADANSYKRPPVMSAAEREAEVASCKCVTKVIPNAPCFGLTEDFLKKHKIHVVAFGQEYLDRFPNPDDDPYYKVPRKMGIAVPMPRHEGLSTSDLIRRIQTRGADEKKSPT